MPTDPTYHTPEAPMPTETEQTPGSPAPGAGSPRHGPNGGAVAPEPSPAPIGAQAGAGAGGECLCGAPATGNFCDDCADYGDAYASLERHAEWAIQHRDCAGPGNVFCGPDQPCPCRDEAAALVARVATPAPSVPAAPGDDFCCTSAAWHWLYRMAQAGRGEVRFGITEDGDTGLWWDAYCGGEWTMGVGDTAEEAVASAMRRHPDPDAEPVVDEQTRERWQAWREANAPAPSPPDAGRRAAGEAREGAVRFAGLVLDAARAHDAIGADLDGDRVQEWALECGLLESARVTAPCGDGCACDDLLGEFPTDCLRFTDAGRAAISAALATPSAGGAQ